MADVIRKAINKFTKGLVMDFSPENTKNEVLTHALNATLLTFNGNELSLQNDMGNGRVETAFLPEGYMPVGTCEYGGIIYIVSYNPLENKSQIGCFPSPERNVSSDELGQSDGVTIQTSDFQILGENNLPTGDLKNTSKYVLLRNDNLNPGDKFIINSDSSIYSEAITNLQKNYDGVYEDVPNPMIALNVVSIEDSGRIIYLNSDLRDYEKVLQENPHISAKYHILGENPSSVTGKIDLDSYRNVLSSGYNVFRSKTSGKLAILAELVTIDSYSVTHSVVPKKITIDGVTQNHEGHYDVIVHTEVEPQVTLSNYTTIPKLSYYHLENSQGYLQMSDRVFELFTPSGYLNENFLGVNLKDVLSPTENNSTETINLDQAVGTTGKFNFPRKDTYHGRMEEHDEFITEYNGKEVYTKFSEDKYHRVLPSQVKESGSVAFKDYFLRELQAKFYRYNPNNTGYQKWTNTTLDNTLTYYVSTTEFAYEDANRNEVHKNKTLYKNVSEYKTANDTVINDTSIEKYQEIQVFTATKASQAELDDWERVTLYEKVGDGYEEFRNKPIAGVTYYTVEIDSIMKPIGKSINASDYKGDIYYCPGNTIYVEATEKDLELYWDFTTYPTNAPIVLYYRTNKETFKLASESEMQNFVKDAITLYYKNDYELILGDKLAGALSSNTPIFVVVPMDSYVTRSEFVPDPTYNYIQGCDKPSGSYPKDDPLILCTIADYVPVINTRVNELGESVQEVEQYPDIKLGGIKIPGILTAYGIDLPFKYSYSLTPCMNYGKLKHLSVSNTVDFSNLHAFEQSNFNEWRYHIDGNQLRITFGAEIFDTHEDYKVDGLILEFYDLWGFAGSLEINNRKSYSGTFTKLLSLNTIGALSKNRILNGNYDNNFKRNVNIYQSTKDGKTIYKYLDKEVVYSDEGGWTGVIDSEDDCGVLYSNLIYGVKAYLRRTTDTGVQFIHKKDYFLFTLPIYNDYYYTITDFNTLVNPKLEMQLTYKLVDSSTKTPYSDTANKISNGYSEIDSGNISKFTSNSGFDGTSLNVTKYYQYKGASNLYLEVGLKEDYKSMNLVYDPDINEFFNCSLQLVGEESGTDLYTIQSQESPLSDSITILNYKNTNGTLPLSINKFGFTTSHSGTVNIKDLKNKRFITYSGSDPVVIDYNFVVGYGIDMTDIVLKEYPVTTICALFHKTDTGDMNWSDFNISKRDDNGTTKYLHDCVIYNAGTRNKRKLGVAAQQHTSGNAENQISSISQDFTEEGKEMTAGKANSGEAMKFLLPFIGKLSFCQPHAHAIYPDEGVSVHGKSKGANGKFESGHDYHMITPDYGGKKLHESWADSYDNTWGSIPVTRMFDTPLYNMVLNTENSIKLQSEFISSMMHGTLTGQQAMYESTSDGWMQWMDCGTARKFIGLDGTKLATFNQKLLRTMAGVFAYNPDYNTHKVLSGKTNIHDYRVQVNSNIVSNNSNFTFPTNKTMNDYVGIGQIRLSDYLNKLNEYSGIRVKNKVNGKDVWLDLLQFTPDLTYCGTTSNPYLITSLTYNFVSDSNMISDLAAEKVSTVVRTCDGQVIPISGTVDPNRLYGYAGQNKYYDNLDSFYSNYTSRNCLWALDVDNYQILYDGTVQCSKESVLQDNSIVHTNKAYSWSNLKTSGYTVPSTYSNKCIRGTTITINDLVYKPNEDHRLYIRNGCYQYNSQYRSKLFYGVTTIYKVDSGNSWTNWGNTKGDWSMGDVEKNVMFIANGPGFNPDYI